MNNIILIINNKLLQKELLFNIIEKRNFKVLIDKNQIKNIINKFNLKIKNNDLLD